MSDIREFFQAVETGNADIVRAALSANPELVRSRQQGATPLHYAAINNHREVVGLLLVAGAEINACDEEYNATPIGWANERGHMEMVRYLFDRGADVDLHRAASFGLTEYFHKLLREHPEDVNRADGFGCPIHGAVLWGRAEMVEALLAAGADPSRKTVHGHTALELALRQIDSGGAHTPIVEEPRRSEILAGCRKIVEILRRHGAQT